MECPKNVPLISKGMKNQAIFGTSLQSAGFPFINAKVKKQSWEAYLDNENASMPSLFLF